MGTPSQGSAAVAAARVDLCALDLMPVFAKEMIAGGVAGAFSKTAIAPLERLKILLQTRTNEFRSLGLLKSLNKLRKHDGVLGFYKGNGASVLRIVPYAALHYMAYERYRCWILGNCPTLGTGPVVDLLAGSASGGTAVLCTYPLDLARTKLAFQVNNSDQPSSGLKRPIAPPSYGGIKDVFKGVYAEGGARALYRGVGMDTAIQHVISICTTIVQQILNLRPAISPDIETRLSRWFSPCSKSLPLIIPKLNRSNGYNFWDSLCVVTRQNEIERSFLESSTHCTCCTPSQVHPPRAGDEKRNPSKIF